MYRLLAWWNARAAAGGLGFALLRFTLGLAVPIVLVVILAFIAGTILSGH